MGLRLLPSLGLTRHPGWKEDRLKSMRYALDVLRPAAGRSAGVPFHTRGLAKRSGCLVFTVAIMMGEKSFV